MSAPKSLYGFEWQRSKELPDRGIVMHMYKHSKFGCEFLYVQTNEPMNTFDVHVRTPLINDSGTPHMLEHLTLNGSKKYPIKNVFFRLSSRSYATYMNAMTFPEFTAFPFSTINEKDFFNNIDVYLDCVFHPSLEEIDFLSECHHLEFKDNDPANELKHSGVIYNEMSGSFSSPERIFSDKLRRELYPDSVTRFCSGGLPSEVPKAKLEELQYLHDTYYHPTNAQFLYYGRIAPEKVFKKVAEAIDSFEPIENPYNRSLFDLKEWTEPKKIEISVPANPQLPIEEQYALNVSYVINVPMTDDHFYSAILMIADLLSDAKDSPLRKALIDTGIAKTITMRPQLAHYYPTVSISVKGISSDSFDAAEKAIFDTLQSVYENGFDMEKFETNLHENRLSLKKQEANGGLHMFYSTAIQWIHGADPLNLADYDSNLNILDENGHKPDYFKNILKAHLIDNKHCVISRTIPDPNYFEAEKAKNNQELQKLKDSLSKEEIEKIINTSKEIEKIQKEEQPLHLLPAIHVNDLGEGIVFRSPDVVEDDTALFVSNTSGLSDACVSFVLPKDTPYLWAITIYCSCCSALGAGKYDEYQLEQFMHRWFLMPKTDISCTTNDNEEIEFRLTFSAMVLETEIDKFCELVELMFTQVHFDNYSRLEKFMKEHVMTLSSLIANSSYDLLNSYTRSTLSESAAMRYRIRGIESRKKLLNVLTTSKPEEFSKILVEIQKIVLKYSKIKMAASVTKSHKDKIMESLKNLKRKLTECAEKIECHYEKQDNLKINEYTKPFYFSYPTQTGFLCCMAKVETKSWEERFRLEILAKIMSDEVFLKEFRELRGCYGAFVGYNVHEQIFGIRTYRDTHPIANSKLVPELIEKTKQIITKDVVEHAAIQILSAMDTPTPPQADGLDDYISGNRKDLLELARKEFLSVTPEQLIADLEKIPKNMVMGVWTSESVEAPEEGWNVIKVDEM